MLDFNGCGGLPGVHWVAARTWERIQMCGDGTWTPTAEFGAEGARVRSQRCILAHPFMAVCCCVTETVPPSPCELLSPTLWSSHCVLGVPCSVALWGLLYYYGPGSVCAHVCVPVHAPSGLTSTWHFPEVLLESSHVLVSRRRSRV